VLAKKAGERPESLRYDDFFQIRDLNISGISMEAERDLSLSQIDEEVMEPESGTAAPLLLLFIMKNSDEQRKIPYSFIIFFTRSNSLIYNG
jgi:hypothetical protein